MLSIIKTKYFSDGCRENRAFMINWCTGYNEKYWDNIFWTCLIFTNSNICQHFCRCCLNQLTHTCMSAWMSSQLNTAASEFRNTIRYFNNIIIYTIFFFQPYSFTFQATQIYRSGRFREWRLRFSVPLSVMLSLNLWLVDTVHEGYLT